MNPKRPEARRFLFLFLLTLLSGLSVFALFASPDDATHETTVDGDIRPWLFESPIQTPHPIGVITDEALARVLDARRYAYPSSTPMVTVTQTAAWTATVTRTPDHVYTATPLAVALAERTTTFTLYIPLPIIFDHNWKGVGNAIDPGQTWTSTAHLDNFNLGWWYDWGDDDGYGEYDGDGFVPMVWCGFFGNDIDPLRDLVVQHPGRTWLVFNEPDPGDQIEGNPRSGCDPKRDPYSLFRIPPMRRDHVSTNQQWSALRMG